MVELEGALIAGKYRVKRRIGAGGMGAVYEGEHVEIGKRVAIKVIEHAHARTPELAARFKREARAASAVESEHIVHVFDVGTDDAVGLYMVMELLSGEDLASLLERRGGRLPAAEALPLALQAARGLAKAHQAGVVHRDLKPANLFLAPREDGTSCVKVLDFGISKLARGEADETGKTSALTREGAVMGTPMYMSPEQAQGLPVDARTDVWSLGAVVYECLAGRPPYEPRPTYEMMIVQIVTQRPRPLAEVAPHVPPEVCKVVDAALAHDREQRAKDAGGFARALADAMGAPPARASEAAFADTAVAMAPAPALATSAGVVLPRRERAGGLAIAAVAVVAAAAVGIFVLGRGPRAAPAPSAGLVQPPVVPSAAPEPAQTLLPIALPAASPPASVVTAAPPARSPTKPSVRTAGSATARPSTPTQYGGAGLDTTYK